MLHDMGFGKRDHRACLQRDYIDMHILTHIRRVNKPRGGPSAIRPGHFYRRKICLITDKRLWRLYPLDSLIGFSDPVKNRRLCFRIYQRPFRACWNISVTARRQNMRIAR